MALIEVGRVCVKLRGNDAGEYCVIADTADKNTVIVEGENVKRGKVNIKHIEPLPATVKIKKGADSKTVLDAMKKADLP
ncbi:MAG: 50S ribosomal protein L14e [Candidatus Altiarchaeota archaeon]